MLNEWSPPIVGLVKEESKNPGTIISQNIPFVKFGERKVYVFSKRIKTIKYYNSELFNLSKEDYKRLYDRDLMYREIIRKHVDNKILKLEEKFLKKLNNENYSIALNNSNTNDFLEEIEKVYTI